MSDHSEEELQASLRSKLKLDTDATNEDPELEEIENVDLVDRTAIIHTKLIQKGTPLQLNKLNLLTLVKQKPTHIPTGFSENMTTPLAEICPPDPPTE